MSCPSPCLRFTEEYGFISATRSIGMRPSAHHLQARNVSPIEPVMPLAWLIVETNDRELPVVCEGECSKRGRTATQSIVEGYKS